MECGPELEGRVEDKDDYANDSGSGDALLEALTALVDGVSGKRSHSLVTVAMGVVLELLVEPSRKVDDVLDSGLVELEGAIGIEIDVIVDDFYVVVSELVYQKCHEFRGEPVERVWPVVSWAVRGEMLVEVTF